MDVNIFITFIFYVIIHGGGNIMKKRKMSTRILFAIVGALLLSLGLQVTIGIDWGVSMFDTSTLAMEYLTGVNFGNAAVLLHAIYLIIMIVGMKKLQSKWPELAISALSIFVLTRIINAFEFIANSINFSSFAVALVVFVVSVFIFNIGIYFMSKSNLFIAPYDRFVLQLSWALGKELGTARLISDIILFAITIIINFVFGLGVTISLGTAYIIFTSGPQINIIGKIFKIEDVH